MRQPIIYVTLLLVAGALGCTQSVEEVGSTQSPLREGEVEIIRVFDPSVGELPEGVTADRHGNVYFTLAPLGQVRRIDASGAETTLAVLDPAVTPGLPGALGLDLDEDDNVYAALISFNPATHGVWKIGQDGSTERLDGSWNIVWPNSVVFDGDGNLYVTDSVVGAVWRIPPGGSAGIWAIDASLAGTGALGFGVPLGANGIAYRADRLYVANTEQGHVVEIAIQADGSAGTPSVIASGPQLFPLDGLTVDARGDLYPVVIGQHSLVRVSARDGSITVLATAADGTDLPASAAFGGKGAATDIFLTNYAFAPPPLGTGNGPSLMRVGSGHVGIP